MSKQLSHFFQISCVTSNISKTMSFRWLQRLKHVMQRRRKVISIIGTTGVGKSQLSIELATKFNGEIINADSMQMYVGLDQITNKHPMDERNEIPHSVMNHVRWNEKYYIHRFKKECEDAMNKCWENGRIPILVGGTHYYLQSVLFENKTIGSGEDNEDLNFNSLTTEQQKVLDSEPEVIFEELKKMDPVVAMKFHPKDIRRVRRALEVCYVKGRKASDVYAEQREKVELQGSCLKYDTLFLWIYSKTPELEERLDSRVNKMMKNGALSELCELYKLYKSGVSADSGVWQVIGFKEFLPFLEKYGTDRLKTAEGDTRAIKELLDDKEFTLCCDEMKLKTRKYAKKQVKWIKNLLGPELQQEEVKFGKMYVLDATYLSVWNENVLKRGVDITSSFLENKSIEIIEVPESLETEGLVKEGKSSLDKTENWRHHTCEVCTDKDTNEPLIFVGEQWEIHLKSKKHRHSLNRGKRKREYEEWLENKKNGESGNIL